MQKNVEIKDLNANEIINAFEGVDDYSGRKEAMKERERELNQKI